jgi:hypothetical protein
MHALQTRYAGRYFRSRLEARWAVFFNAINIPWVYEPQGYQLPDKTCYLPDFFLPLQECFIEIKPRQPTREEERKYALFASISQYDLFLFAQPMPGYQIDGGYPTGQTNCDSAYLFAAHCMGVNDYNYTWCICGKCSKLGIEFDGRGARICHHDTDDKGYSFEHARLLAAYDMANSARFDD